MSAPVVRPFAEQGHFTTVHNLVFRQIMPAISANAFKVLCFIISETHGYNRRAAGLSYEDIKVGTGIGGNTTISNALTELLNEEQFGCALILRKEAEVRGKSRREKTRYAINRNFAITLQKRERNSAPETGEPEKFRSPKMRAKDAPKMRAKRTAHIENAPVPTEKSNEESNILSLCAGEEDFAEIEEDETPPTANQPTPQKPDLTDDRAPFVEGEVDGRFESPHFLALASEEVCDLDLDILDYKAKSVAAMVAVQLATKYTPEQILEAGRRWDLPSKPHPRQLLSRIKALLSEPRTQSQNPDPENSHAIHQRTSAQNARPKYPSAAERRGRDLTESLDDFQQREADLAEKKRRLAEL